MVKIHSVIAEFSIVPMCTVETSVGRYVATVVGGFKNVKGLDFEVTPMSTVLVANTGRSFFKRFAKPTKHP